jgi:hypothetical protein
MTAFDDERDEPGDALGEFVEARTVRPYTVTGGRTRSGSQDLPMEALVRALRTASQDTGMAPERKRILELTSSSIMSVAELSAHLHLPLGVTRVLVGDLASDGAVVVHGATQQSASPATNLKVLESVLNGISSL